MTVSIPASVTSLESKSLEYAHGTEKVDYTKLQAFLGVEFPTRPRTSKGKAAAAAAPAPAAAKADDDDIDFFGEDDEDDIASRELEKKAQAALAARKAAGKDDNKAGKTSILLDVKPWDDTTDMAAMEAAVRAIEMAGLVWGSSKLVPVGYGIKKLSIMCVVEDDKVCVDDLEEAITGIEDHVQSMDVAAMNKV